MAPKNNSRHTGQNLGSKADTSRRSQSGRSLLSPPSSDRLASEEQFNAFFENANVGATQLDRTGRFVAVNGRFSEITGYSREELLAGMTPLDLSYPDDRERDRELLMPFVEGRTSPYQIEKRYVRKDGRVIWVKITGGTIRDRDGCAVQTAGIIEDITARKTTEAELDALRRRLAADLNSMVRLHQISTRFFQEANLGALLEESLETAIDITGADMGKIQLFEECSGTLKMAVHRGFGPRFLKIFATIGVGRAACGEAARRRERVIVENIAESALFIGTPELDAMLEAGVRAIQSTPLISRSGRLVGVLSTHYRAPCRPDEGNLRLLDVLARQVTDLIEAQQAQEALRESEQRLRDVMDHANATVWLKDLEGRFLMVNRYLEKKLRLSNDEILGRTVFDLFLEAEASEYAANDRQVLSSGQPMEFEETQTEADGEHTYIARKFPLRNAEGRIHALCAICTDVTERKAAEQALRHSREDLNHAQAVAQTGSWRLDVRRNQLLWSDETYRIFGIPPGTLLTYETFLSAVHPEDRASVDQKWKAALEGERYDAEHRIIVEGDLKWIRERAELEFDCEGKLLGGFGTCQDITYLKKAEENLRELARTLEDRVAERTAELEQRAAQLLRLNQELTRVEQRERRRLAELLHDGLQQMLVAAKFRVTEARRRVHRGGALEENLNCIDELLTQSLETSRSLTTELSPPVLQELGLVPALGWLADFMATKHGLRVDLSTDGKAEPSSLELRLLLFPIARELLFNIVKHAGVRAAHVLLERNGQSLRLKVADLGCGFDVSKWQRQSAGSGHGFGLLNVQNRVELAGGKLEVDSAPGRGTSVTVTVPV